MRLAFIPALMIMTVPSAAGARDVTIHLTAEVEVMCGVTDVRPLDLQRGALVVEAYCNSDSFQLQMGGDVGLLPLSSASADSAAVSVNGNGVQVTPRRPGAFSFVLNYDRDLSQIQVVTASLDAA